MIPKPILILTAVLALAPAASASDGPVVRTTTTRGGISVTMTVDRVAPSKDAPALREGDDVIVRFEVRDTVSGAPIRGSRPGAWMDSTSRANRPESCSERVRAYAGSSFFDRAEIDLNTFFVAAMNDDATITVVDPLFNFGGTNLLAMIPLASPAEDWALSRDEGRIFVSMPKAKQLAEIETKSWKVVRSLPLPAPPSRLVLQPDGAYLWAALPDGVAVIRTRDFTVAATIRTGISPRDVAFTANNRYALVANGGSGTVSVIDVWTLKKSADIAAGAEPVSIAWSPLASTAWVAGSDGTITIIGGRKPALLHRIATDGGLVQARTSPDGRLVLFASPKTKSVLIGDTSKNRIVQKANVPGEPDEIAFSPKLAYIRLRDSGDVQMLTLAGLGQENAPAGVADFPGGQRPFGAGAASRAATIVQAADEDAMLIANPADKAIYYYSEGMAAPMGHFTNFDRQPRAALVIDRSLRERGPGVYETSRHIDHAGTYDVAFLLDSPRLTTCQEVTFAADPARPHVVQPKVDVTLDSAVEAIHPGEKTSLRFRVGRDGAPLRSVADGTVLIFAPGVWQARLEPRPAGDGTFVVEFTPPASGVYSAYLAAPSLGLPFTWFGTLRAQ